MPPALETLTKAFGDKAIVYNGKISKAKRSKLEDIFNDDNSGVNIAIVQRDAGGTGVNFHDKTGQYPRQSFNISLPQMASTEFQIFGRTYRTGQQSDMAFTYLTTHLPLEEEVFVYGINEKLGINNAFTMGDKAKNIKQIFKDGYANALGPDESISFSGGKDMIELISMDGWEKAIAEYYTKGNMGREVGEFGGDFFPTPEPIGYKMAQWADIRYGSEVLEPSAGRGSIARSFPEGSKVTLVESNKNLLDEAFIRSGGNVLENGKINKDFLDYAKNTYKRFDNIIMNPPFGKGTASGHKTAFSHFEAAFNMLTEHRYGKDSRQAGRLVAILPDSEGMNRQIANFVQDNRSAVINTRVRLPSIAFEGSGTKVATQILIVDKDYMFKGNDGDTIDLRDCKDFDELLERINEIDISPKREIDTISKENALAIMNEKGEVKDNSLIIKSSDEQFVAMVRDSAKSIDKNVRFSKNKDTLTISFDSAEKAQQLKKLENC